MFDNIHNVCHAYPGLQSLDPIRHVRYAYPGLQSLDTIHKVRSLQEGVRREGQVGMGHPRTPNERARVRE